MRSSPLYDPIGSLAWCGLTLSARPRGRLTIRPGALPTNWRSSARTFACGAHPPTPARSKNKKPPSGTLFRMSMRLSTPGRVVTPAHPTSRSSSSGCGRRPMSAPSFQRSTFQHCVCRKVALVGAWGTRDRGSHPDCRVPQDPWGLLVADRHGGCRRRDSPLRRRRKVPG
jgi:hypothetical protein